MPLYLAKDRDCTVISRSALHVPGGRRVRRGWDALVEDRVPEHHARVDPTTAVIAAIGLTPVLVMLPAVQYLGPAPAVGVGSLTLLLSSAVVFLLHRRRVAGSLHNGGGGAPADARRLTAMAECTAFDRAVATADRVAATWPGLGDLIDVPEASAQLAEALWEISGRLARRQELTEVLAELSRPELVAQSPADGSAERLRAQVRAAKEAVEADLTAREASLLRAEEAGRTFIREREMLEAIRAAERSLSTPATPAVDPAADLAEHTRLVLTAYRELTTATNPGDDPAR